MKKAIAIIWHLLILAITAYLLFIVVSNISASLTKVDRDAWHWPAVQTGIITMTVIGFITVIAAFSASALFAREVGKARRIVATILLIAVLVSWLYVAILWVNYPFKTMPTTIFAEMINFDGVILVFISSVLLAIPAFTGRGLFGHLIRMNPKNRRAQQGSDGQA